MPETPDFTNTRLRQIEDVIGIAGIGTPATFEYLPVGSVFLAKTADLTPSFGTWTLLGSGPVLGGAIGTVYAWQRTA